MSLMVQNFVLFQLGWFSCVLGGASSDYHWLGVVVVFVIIAAHLARAHRISDEVMLILATTLLGASWDSLLLNSGLYSFSHGVLITGLVPLWLVAMWSLFATTLNVSLGWMKNRYLLAAIFGAAGGPTAYYAGHRLGAVEFSDTLTALLAVGAGWTVIMPLLVLLSTRYDGYRKTRRLACEAGAS